MELPPCDYCGASTRITNGREVYNGRDFGKQVLVCSQYPRCDAYVGCHRGTDQPMGPVADFRLRESRQLAHKFFDRLWKNGKLSRGQAYQRLEDATGVQHIGQSSNEQCNAVMIWAAATENK